MKRFISMCVFMYALNAHAQQFTTADVIPLFQQTSSQIADTLAAKSFNFKKKAEGISIYLKESWGDACIVRIGYKAGKLNAFAVQQHVGHFNFLLPLLYQNEFTLTSSNVETEVPIPGQGYMYRFDNKKLKLICSIIFPLGDSNSFIMSYGKQ